MIGFLVRKIFGSKNDRFLKKLRPLVAKINALEPEMQALADEELPQRLAVYREQVQNGEKDLDAVLPEVFALVREASTRVLGMRHYDVQLLGAMALHNGKIAEMKTGEGKTLVATLAVILNSLEGKGVHVVTVNDYLAKRDAEWMGRLYNFLGLSVGVIVAGLSDEQRKEAYGADITYGTNNEFGFDYLRDNMKFYAEQLVQRGHHYAIVDEVDSILIDEARTPLIISGASDESTDLYQKVDEVVRTLEKEKHYTVDEKGKTASLTDEGVLYVEEQLGIENLYDTANITAQHHVLQSLKAHTVFRRDVDYIVKDDQVVIVDEFTGRLMAGRRFSDGLHQALEAKEHVTVAAENQTLASITFQNYFRMYDKLSGMTGTAETEAAEFMGTYKLGVLPIPTNKPMIREDKDDLIFRTKKEKLAAIVRDVAKRHKKGQPVLLGTASVESSEIVSSLLDVANIPHQVLNAKQHDKEAAVVAVAGRKGAVTVATNMAGRGTDIMLGGNVEFLADAKLKSEGYSPDDTPDEYEKRWPGTLAEIKEQVKDEHEEVVELGGLYVLGTERHESRRIDNQLRGRSGRQGDPGESRFYLSLEDDLMRLFNTQLVARVMAKGMPEGEPIEAKSVSKGVRTAQKAVESRNFEIRKNVLKYDDVMNKQRTVIYAERQAVLKGEDIHEDILKFVDDTVLSYIKGANKGSDKPKDWDWEGLFKALNAVYPIAVDPEAAKDAVSKLKGDKAIVALQELIVSDAKDQYADFEAKLGEEGLRQLERRVVLAVLDRKWREHLYEMDYLKDGIGLRGMGQRDPLVEYQREGYQMYNSMIEAIKEETIQLLFHVDIDRVATTEDADTESDEEEAVNAAEAVMGLDSEAQPTGETAPAEPETDDESEKTVIDELAEEQKNEPGIVGMQPISHAEGKVPANKRPKSEELHSPWADGRTFPGTGKNAQCPCGSGRKYKMCHGQNEQ